MNESGTLEDRFDEMLAGSKHREVFMLFGGVIVIISAILSGGFFYDYFPTLVPVEVFGETLARGISAAIGVIVFDVGAMVWLLVYIRFSENDDQRHIALTTSVIDICGSAAASFVMLLMQAVGLVDIDPTARVYIGWVAVVITAGVLVWNFISVWRFEKESQVNKMKIQNGAIMGKVQRATAKMETQYTTTLVSEMQKQLLAHLENDAREEAAILANKMRSMRRNGHVAPNQPSTDQPLTKKDLESMISTLLMGTGGGAVDEKINDTAPK